MNKHDVSGRCPVRRLALAVLAAAMPSTLVQANPAWRSGAAPPPTSDPDCLAQAIYYEARGEPIEGRQAVAEVVMNRLRSGRYGRTVCGVVFQGAERSTGCQFSFTCDGSRGRLPEGSAWRDALALAQLSLDGQLPALSAGSTHYHALYVQPGWSRTMAPTLQVGGHRFYAATGFRRIVAAPASSRPPPAAAATAVNFSVWGVQVAAVTPAPAPDRSPTARTP